MHTRFFLLFGLVTGLLTPCTVMADSTRVSRRQSAQHDWHIGISGGYGFGLGQQAFGSTFSTTTANTPIRQVSGSLGTGPHVGVLVGRWFNERVAAEVGIDWLRSNSYKTTYQWSRDFIMVEGLAESQLRLNAIRLNIGLLAPFHETEHFQFALRAGFSCAVPQLREYITFYNMLDVEVGHEERLTRGRIAPGFYAAFVANRALGRSWQLRAEVLGIAQTWAPGKRTITEYQLDGQDQLALLSTWSKEVVYEQEVPAQQTNPNVPYQVLRVHYLMSNIGVQLTLIKQF